ncbi:MAG TPA: tripartite tricarboxylate transporter substrate binding protein [Pseudolabrys sp.]|nr:tripartite tricarboxylate transporter substrate binding protein [Pseudolabrys sp.]
MPNRRAPTRRSIIKGATALAAGFAAPAFLRVRSAYAAYPDRPVKIVVANTPGGPSDLVARIVTAALDQSTGKTFIVENRGGAGGNIGMGYVAHSDADGYTFLLATTAFSVNPGLYNHLPFDPLKDFVAVSELAGAPNIFVVQKDSPAKSMKEFVALARANPEKYNVSVPPIGTTPQLQATLLKSRENLPKLQEVVFKGGGDALQALLAGTVQLASNSLGPCSSHLGAGTLRGLAICSEQRWPDFPDIPTMQEAGYKDFVFATDMALLAPAKTPPECVRWLETETIKVMSTPQMKDKLYQNGFLVRPKGAAAAWTRMTKEMAQFKDIIETAKIKKL